VHRLWPLLLLPPVLSAGILIGYQLAQPPAPRPEVNPHEIAVPVEGAPSPDDWKPSKMPTVD
jgi:hypothetical protein